MLNARVSGQDLGVKVWQFPCGEVGVKLEKVSDFTLAGEHVWVELEWENNNDFMALAQLVDVIKAAGARSWSLNIPYFPYSRQDRRCAPSEAHALKVFAMMLNNLGFSLVRTLDAHSYVLEALVENLDVVPQEECAYNLPVFDYLIAPDAGAEKKVFKHYQVRDEMTQGVLCASKVRGLDGKILSATIHGAEVIEGKNVCVVDDLCDGGATFIELGKLLRQYKPKTMSLYVTHGMFTKGVDSLLDLYDNLYTHNLCNQSAAVSSRVTQI